MSLRVQWYPSNPDTLGTIPSVLFSEVSWIQGFNSMIWGCNNCSFYRDVLISECPDRGFNHCSVV